VGLLHHFLKHQGEHLRCFVTFSESVSPHDFLQQLHIVFLRHMSNELLVEELDPEADQLFSFNLPRFEYAEEVEKVLPGH